jgi:hypothetical protein
VARETIFLWFIEGYAKDQLVNQVCSPGAVALD